MLVQTFSVTFGVTFAYQRQKIAHLVRLISCLTTKYQLENSRALRSIVSLLLSSAYRDTAHAFIEFLQAQEAAKEIVEEEKQATVHVESV